jgi:CHAD domain-containing protein
VSLEIEAKFLVTGPGAYDRVRALTRIGGYALLEGRMENVLDVYRDTTDRALLSAGYACRYRQREGELVVTVKSVAPPQNNVHRREELEVTIPEDVAPAAWPESAAREKVLGLIGQSPLEELFRLSQSRFVRPLVEGARSVASASLDLVRVGVRRTVRLWRELEVELAPTGTEEDLAAISGWLRRTLGLRPARGSKFEKALDIAGRRARARRPAGAGPEKSILLEAPEKLSEGIPFSTLAGMGYTSRERRQRTDHVTFLDTHDGAFLKKGFTVSFSRSIGTWRLCEGEVVRAEQNGLPGALPAGDSIASAMRAVSDLSPSIPLLEAVLLETEYEIEGIAAHMLRILARHWTFLVPAEESSPRTLLRLAVAGPSTASAYFSSLLQARFEFQLSRTPLVERGLSLLGLTLPGAPLPAEFRVGPADTTGRACGRVLRGEAWRMRANMRGAVHDLHPEFVHDLRVATRRARSALRLFAFLFAHEERRALADELGWIAHLLGAVRDLDVLTARLDAQFEMTGAGQDFRDAVREAFHARRTRAVSELVPALQSDRFARLVRTLEDPRLPQTGPQTADAAAADKDLPAEQFARRRIDKAFSKLGLWIDRPPENMTDAELHRVRILFKRLRYMCEFFRPLLGNDAGSLIGAFVGYQDCLGLHQDATTALTMLSEAREDVPHGERSEGFLLSMGAMLQVQRDIQSAQREIFARRWKSALELIMLWKRMRGAMGDRG